MEQNVYRMSMSVCIRHPRFQIYGISSPFEMDYYRFDSMARMDTFPVVQIRNMASNLQVIVQADFSTFQPIDARPELVTSEKKHIDDFKIFRPLNAIQEIVVAQPSVKDLLDKIVAQQDPKQAEIREKRRKKARRFDRIMEGIPLEEQIIKPSEEIVAQIVAIA